MVKYHGELIGLIFSTFLIICLFLFIRKNKHKQQLKFAFFGVLFSLLICCVGLALQILIAGRFNINPLYFEYVVYVGTCGISFFYIILSNIFVKTKIHFTWKYLLLLIVPIICLITLWTNDFHHMFYISYSTELSQTVGGLFFYITAIYVYASIFFACVRLLHYSIKNSGFFSLQCIFIIIGTLIPIIVNMLGILNIFKISIYITPICFTFTILFYAFAIFRFDFLKVAPIALQRVVDRISDGYVIVDEENIITDFNKTFLDLFHLKTTEARNNSIEKILDKISFEKKDNEYILSQISASKNSTNTVYLEKHFPNIEKYFNIEISSITNKDSFLGTLILFKDITQHVLDIQTINENQEVLIEKERLATLGQMIGGIAHNLKTPIMSIAGAAEGLSDLSKEYRESIGDPEVTVEDHLEISHDMDEWIEKIRTHLAYMSDIITAVKGQAVTFSDSTVNNFTVEELLKNVDILMKHELKHSLITMDVSVDVPQDTTVNGNVNSLVQVVNNIISNAIQAYNGKPDEHIFLNVYKENNTLVIKIQDNAGGLPQKVQEKLFKEMITTKGKNRYWARTIYVIFKYKSSF